MNILRFNDEFPTEEACKVHFKAQREKEGVNCKKCGSEEHYWLKAKDQWQCKDCDFRTTLKSGSIMEYLQNYLNEFCYKLNHRYFGDRVFDKLTLAVVKSYW